MPPATSTQRAVDVLGAVLPALARRPALWPTALREAGRLARRGWWRRPPFLPLPAADYLAFRLQTMYGAADHAASPDDVLRWLAWCREQDQSRVRAAG